MTPKPEYVLELADKIVKAQKVLDALQAEWDGMFSPNATMSLFGVKNRAVRDGSFSSRVEAVITGEPGRLFTIGQVAQTLGTDDTLKVGRTLFRLHTTNRIANPQRGLYAANKPVEVAA